MENDRSNSAKSQADQDGRENVSTDERWSPPYESGTALGMQPSLVCIPNELSEPFQMGRDTLPTDKYKVNL